MKYNTGSLVKFNLKSSANKSKPYQIMLILNHKGQRLRYYTGKRIEDNNWNKTKQRAKTQYANAATLNAFLNTLANFVEDEYNKMLMSCEIVTIEKLRELINDNQNRTSSGDILNHFGEYIETHKNIRSKGTITNYTTTLSRLKSFIKDTGYHFTYHRINSSFHESYVNYLISVRGLQNQSITKETKQLKSFLNWATKTGYNKNMDFQKFKYRSEESQIYFLAWDELMKLYEKDLSNDERLKKVRDIFCFGCFTGMRFSDIMNLQHENIDDVYISFVTLKTSSVCTIPLNQYSKAIYAKYQSKEGKVFEDIPNQKMNELLKELGKLVGLNTPVQLVSHKGAERIEKIVPKHKILTSHMARKTFITNALAKGMKTEVIMDITTHKDYRVFKRYYKVVDEHKKNEMDKVFG